MYTYIYIYKCIYGYIYICMYVYIYLYILCVFEKTNNNCHYNVFNGLIPIFGWL